MQMVLELADSSDNKDDQSTAEGDGMERSRPLSPLGRRLRLLFYLVWLMAVLSLVANYIFQGAGLNGKTNDTYIHGQQVFLWPPVQSDQTVALNLVALYRTLGGGWQKITPAANITFQAISGRTCLWHPPSQKFCAAR